MEEKKIIAYKGFDENLCCRGYQFEVGKEYEQEGEIVCCENGFHACTNPFDVLNHYSANGKNRFCVVEQSGVIKSGEDSNTKQASSKIKIKAEIGISGLFEAAIEWLKEITNPDIIEKETKEKDNIERSYGAQIGSRYFFDKICSSGDVAKIGSIGDDVQIGSSGYGAKIGSSGFSANIDSTGEYAIICCAGHKSMAKAKKGSWISLAEWKYSEEKKHDIPVCVKTEFVDGERIKEDTWYKLVDGEFKEEQV